MEKISQLMDGELEGRECDLQLKRLKEDAALAQSWAAYHLIRDVLRDEACMNMDLARRVHERLEKEPTVIAPHTRLVARVVRYTLPMAATVAGVAVVGWLALSFRPQIESVGFMTAQAPQAAIQAPPPKPVERTVLSANGQMNDYLLAHQEFSPSSDLQGLAPYIRTVSNRDPETVR
ncbi:MAG TPA: sigma-E factor negative regulatory protein [Burkholderiales bacterium]|nr:sigma-E factor negative regulatory protein [Burkholderiales bacterium]